MDQIPIVYQHPPENFDGRKGIFSTAPIGPAVATVPVAQLAAGLEAVCAQLSMAFAAVRPRSDTFDLESFEVLLDVTATGEVRLVGSVSPQTESGGLRMTFKRRPGTV